MPSILDRILQPIRVSARTPPFVQPRYGERGNYEDFGNYDYGGTQPGGSWEDWENEPSYHTGVPSPASPTPGPIEVAASQAPRKADYQRGLGRRILGGIIEAASPLAAGFGVNPHIVGDLGRDVSAPGYNRAMDEWVVNKQLAEMTSAEQEKRRRLELQQQENELRAENSRISAEYRALAEQNRQDALEETKRKNQQQSNWDEMELARRQGWQRLPMEERTYGNLQAPMIPARPPLTSTEIPTEQPLAPSAPTTPLNQIPARTMPITGMEPSAPPEGYERWDIPRSRFSPPGDLVAGAAPTPATRARQMAEAKMIPLDSTVRQILIDNKERLNLPPEAVADLKDETILYSPDQIRNYGQMVRQLTQEKVVMPGGQIRGPGGKLIASNTTPAPTPTAEGSTGFENIRRDRIKAAAGALIQAYPNATVEQLKAYAKKETPPDILYDVYYALEHMNRPAAKTSGYSELQGMGFDLMTPQQQETWRKNNPGFTKPGVPSTTGGP